MGKIERDHESIETLLSLDPTAKTTVDCVKRQSAAIMGFLSICLFPDEAISARLLMLAALPIADSPPLR